MQLCPWGRESNPDLTSLTQWPSVNQWLYKYSHLSVQFRPNDPVWLYIQSLVCPVQLSSDQSWVLSSGPFADAVMTAFWPEVSFFDSLKPSIYYYKRWPTNTRLNKLFLKHEDTLCPSCVFEVCTTRWCDKLTAAKGAHDCWSLWRTCLMTHRKLWHAEAYLHWNFLTQMRLSCCRAMTFMLMLDSSVDFFKFCGTKVGV